MASLRDAVKDYQEELRGGIAWVVFWREGRSWKSDYLYLEAGSDTIEYDDLWRLEQINSTDPRAVALNGYYCGRLGEDMNTDQLTAGVRWHYENGYNTLAEFMEAHTAVMSPELIEEARQIAHAAGLPFSEKPYRGEDFDPYSYDGSMTPEDYELMHTMIAKERSNHMSEQFSILIDSRSRFETGQPGGEWLTLPATAEQLHAAMQRIGITADNPQDFFINGIANTEDCPFDVPLEVIQRSSMDELNYLAALLEMQSDEDKGKFAAAVTHGEYAGNLKDLINLVQNLDCYWIYPTVQSEKDYGYYLIDELDDLELPNEAKKYFMYEEYGRDAVTTDGGRFTEQGYIYNNKNTFTEWYDGRDVPEEYRIMSYPQPPTRPDPEKADMDAAPVAQAATMTAEPPQPRPVIPLVLNAEKPAEKLKEITDRLEQGISEIFESGRYKEYLDTMSKFHNYSVNNTILIAMQKPDASLIAGFNSWKSQFERNVKKGEKGIKIIAPSPFKVKKEMEKIDPNTQRPVIGANGKPVTEEQEVTIPAFKVVAVFDVSQTEGKELPDIAVDALTGDVDKYNDFLAALEKTAPVPVAFEKMDSGTHGYYHLEDKRIAIAEGMSELQTLKTTIHEIAHATLHDIDLNAPISEQQSRPDRRTREVEAESIAYTVCQHYGLDTSDYSFGYVAGWSSGKELAELKSSLETIRSTAAELINTIDGHIAEIQKEQTAEQEAKPDLATEPTVTIIWSESSRLHEGETMSLSRANVLFATLDDANRNIPGYDKTKFHIDFMMNGEADQYEGRQDFGDGDGGLIEHIEKYHAAYADNPDWDNYLLLHEGKEALEADKAQRGILLHEFIPYLKLHNNLSEMEQAAKDAMQHGGDLSQTQTAYYTDLQRYVSDCRGALNQGNYELPPVPQLSDFDAELQAYKQQVKEEIMQEAASAGMTVDEYTANGYEPYATPEQDNTFSIYQLKGGDERRDLRFEPYDRLQAAGLTLDPANYELTYTATLESGMSVEGIFERFNLDRPTDFTGHSLSVSDVVVLHQDGQDTAHYVDSFGYKDVPEFLKTAPDLAAEPPQEVKPESSVTYYPINETAARRAKDANSFYDYKPGSATAEYRSMVDEAVELAERQKARVDPMHHEKIDRLLDTYARKLAENMNNSFSIESRVPSILIAGGSNFPVRKKEKQNAARDKNMEEWQDIKGLLDKIRSTGMGGISADDPNVITKLESKLAGLEKSQETMKAVNAYFRKHKTLDGCTLMSPENMEKLKASMSRSYYKDPKPFETWALSNNSAEIRRTKARIEELTHREETPLTGWEFDGGKVEVNKEDNRLQVFFEEKPDADKRTELKKGGFRWSPTAGAWQRQLNGNAFYAANDIQCIQPLTGERPTDLQRAHIRAEKVKEQAEQPTQDSTHDTEQQAATTAPDSFLTGETVHTPRGDFHLTSMTKQEMEAAGYGYHHQSDDGKYFIMGNGTQAFAIQSEAVREVSAQPQQQPTPENPLATAEQTTKQNYNMIDGVINNTPTVDELEAKVKAGEQISLTDLADAIKADKQRGSAPKEKPSIRAQLKEGKEKAAPKKAAKTKNQDLEV